jgi:hypothetical protein
MSETLSVVFQRLLQEAFREVVLPEVRSTIVDALPEVARRAQLPPNLTKRQLQQLTGWSPRKIDYLRERREIPFIKRGRTVLFPTAEIEQYLGEGYVPAKDTPRRHHV